MSIGIFEIDNLRPVLGLGIKPVLDGIKTTSLAYTGPEIMLILFGIYGTTKESSKSYFSWNFYSVNLLCNNCCNGHWCIIN